MTRAKAALLAGILCLGCGHDDFEHLELRNGTRLDALTISVGATIRLSLIAIDSDADEMMCDVALAPDDTRILHAEKATSGFTVVTGLSAGKTSVTVYCDGDVISTLNATVTETPST